MSRDAKTARSREIIARIDRRQLYKVVDTHKRTKTWDKKPTVEQLIAIDDSLDPKSIIIDVNCVGFIGKADGHPLDNIHFYNSQSPNRSYKVKRGTQSKLYSFRYCEYWTRVIVRKDALIEPVAAAWELWKQSV